MPKLNALDYAYPSGQRGRDLKADGIVLVCRYLYEYGKGYTDSERRDLHAAGVGMLQNFEASAGNALLGARQGRYDGDRARNIARSRGVPRGTPIYYSVDRDVLSYQFGAVLDYLHAADHPDYPSRCYGEYDVVNAWYASTKRPGWQTLAWSYGDLSPHACIYQYDINNWWRGHSVDNNELIDPAAVGAWWPAGHPMEPKEGLIVTPDDHKYLQDMEKRINARIDAVPRNTWQVRLGAQKWTAGTWIRGARNSSARAAARLARR